MIVCDNENGFRPEFISKEISKIKNQKSDLVNEINELENTYRDYNYKINVKQNELKNEVLSLTDKYPI